MWCILIPILVGLISAVLGYLLGRLLKNNSNVDINVFKNRIAILEADLEKCRASNKKNTNVDNGVASGAGNGGLGSNMMASNITATPTSENISTVVFNADAAKSIFGKRIKENDLTVVEGIGPKIQELFHNHDVKTWVELANCSVEKCQSILNSGGERFKIHKPGTWPKQSLLASQGKWQELKDWQDRLDGGK
ncbi:hypothetical protein [Pontimicrobium sp. MEBiC01747]|jgi:predicted flap endonuclease-1-like 5' DNA nuclease